MILRTYRNYSYSLDVAANGKWYYTISLHTGNYFQKGGFKFEVSADSAAKDSIDFLIDG